MLLQHTKSTNKAALKIKACTLYAVFTAALFSGLVNSGLQAQPLDLKEALRLAKGKNLALLQQRENGRAASLEIDVQRSKSLPSLDLSLNSRYQSVVNAIDLSRTIGIPDRRVALGGHDQHEMVLGITQPIFTGFRIKSSVELAENASSSETSQLQAMQDQIYHQVYALFYSAQALYREGDILEASLKRQAVQFENVRNLFRSAQVMAFDTLQAYNQILVTRIKKEDLQVQTRLVSLQMAKFLDLGEVRPISRQDLEPPGSEVGSVQALIDTAFSKRSELDGVRLAQQAAQIQQKLARAEYFPLVRGQAAYHYAKPGLDPVANQWTEYFTVGINLQWNLWRWHGDQKRIEQGQVRQRRLGLQERELKRQIEFEVAEAWENVNLSVREWRLAQELEAQEAERHRMVLVQYQNGLASTNDLTTAEADLTAAELKTQQALVRYHLHLAQVQRAVGTIGDKL